MMTEAARMLESCKQCSHKGCNEQLPGSHLHQEIPPGWTVARMKEHGVKSIKFYYIYLCPRHMITSANRQTNLFPNPVSAEG